MLPLFAPAEAVTRAINQAYQQQTGQAQSMIDVLDRESVLEELQKFGTKEDLLDVGGRCP